MNASTIARRAREQLRAAGFEVHTTGVSRRLVVRPGGKNSVGRVTLAGPTESRERAAVALRNLGWMAVALTSPWVWPYPGTLHVLTPPSGLEVP